MPRPADVPPTVVKLGKPHDGYRETHPSYGMIRASRVQGGHENLYGSSVSHQNYIEIAIMRGSRDRHLSTDWYHADHRPLITVKLSPNQFAEFLTNMNCGSGVPCTLDDFNGEMMPDCPERHKRQEVQTEFQDRMEELYETANAAEAKLAELTAPGKAIKKSDVRELQELIGRAVSEIRSGAPFAQKCFNEACDKAAVEAKAEIDAAFTGMVARMGMEAVRERVYELLGMEDAPRATSIEALPAVEKSEGARTAEGRPDNYADLPASEQWEIDKSLGILDWDGD